MGGFIAALGPAGVSALFANTHMPIGQEHRAVCGHPSDRPPECTPARDLRIAWPEQARTVLGEMPRGYLRQNAPPHESQPPKPLH